MSAAPVIAHVSVHGVRVNARGDWLFVRIESHDGQVGIGELSHSGDDALAAWWTVHRLAPRLIGRELVGPLALARELPSGSGRVGATARSAVELALWDLKARAIGVSIQALLGGPVRSSVPLYANINRALVQRDPAAFAEAAASAVRDGFSAIKIAPFDGVQWRGQELRALRAAVRDGVARAAAVREAIGPDIALMVDGHGRFSRELAIEVARELEPLNLFWLEDLLWVDEDPDGVAAVGARIRQPLAAGERNLTLESFLEPVARRLAATVMPDIKHCGGLDEARRIAALAEAARLSVSPHNPAGPVATLASAQLAATLQNFVHLEYAWGEVSFRSSLLDPPERVANGQLQLPTGPGLGAQLSAAALTEHGFDPLAR